MKIPKWSKLTVRERWLSAITAASLSLLTGSLLSRILEGVDVNWDAISAVGTVCGAVITFIAIALAYMGYKQSLMAHQLERRTYLGIYLERDIIFNNPDQAGGEVVRSFMLKVWNYGHTPALKVATDADSVVGFMPSDILPAEPKGIGTGVVHPGGHTEVMIIVDMSHADLLDLRRGDTMSSLLPQLLTKIFLAILTKLALATRFPPQASRREALRFGIFILKRSRGTL